MKINKLNYFNNNRLPIYNFFVIFIDRLQKKNLNIKRKRNLKRKLNFLREKDIYPLMTISNGQQNKKEKLLNI